MRQNQWFAVRCCCTPKKVFGFIKMEAPGSDARIPINREVRDKEGLSHQIKLLSISVRNRDDYCRLSFPLEAPPDVITSFNIPLMEVAIYSDDRPIEFWRSIEGFVEAQSED